MTDSFDAHFFNALLAACQEAAELDPACKDAVKRAVESQAPLDFQRARQEIDRLDAPSRDAIYKRAHHMLATDMSLIWNALPAARKQHRPN